MLVAKILKTTKRLLSLSLLIYFRELAKLELKKNKPLIIGITGSAGKTSLRNAISAICREKYQVKVSFKANSESGIPLNILGLKPFNFTLVDWLRLAILAPIKLLTNWEKYEVYIAEMGIDSPYSPKNMEYLLTILQPKIGVFLNVLPVHSQFFDELVPDSVADQKVRRKKILDLIANEKGKLIERLPQDGSAVLNIDDLRVRKFTKKTQVKTLTFSVKTKANLEASNLQTKIDSFSMDVKEGNSYKTLKLKFTLEEHFTHTLLGAIAVGRAMDISLSDCIRFLTKNFRLGRGRMTVIPGKNDTTILDSSYNASKATMSNALKLLSGIASARKVAILGDLRELGEIGKLEHEEVAKVAATNTDLIITVGPLMKSWFTPRLIKLGFPEENIHSVLNPYQAVRIADKKIRKGDTILVKGSQNTIFLEIVVKSLMANPEEADKLLCRRGLFWNRKREELKN